MTPSAAPLALPLQVSQWLNTPEPLSLAALRVFAHEYRLVFPIGIDQPDTEGPLPLTMQAYGLRGTPSLLLVDRLGRLRLNHFGPMDDLQAGALVGQLVSEVAPASTPAHPGGQS